MEPRQLVKDADIPEVAAAKLLKIVSQHGHRWMTDLLLCPDRKGDGTSGISFSLFDDDEDDEDAATEAATIIQLPDERGLEFFLMDVEAIFEDDEEDEAEWLFRQTLREWISLRIDYLRSVEALNATQARVRAYEESSEVPMGGEELACNNCGSLFWDNLFRLKEAERNYCSLDCQEHVEIDCINCGKHFVVGRPKKGFKNTWRLNGFCDFACYRSDWANRSDDRKYISGVRLRLQASGAVVDQAVTRRAVFDKHEGVCYICGVTTHWKLEGSWDPLLAHVDHIHPVSKGGQHTWENVALACSLCNSRKGAKTS
jgi:hypothetical protein